VGTSGGHIAAEQVFFQLSIRALVADIARQSCAMVPRCRSLVTFCTLYFQWAVCSTFQTCISNSH